MSIRFGLIGRSLKHSFSAQYFSQKFDAEGWNASYDLWPLDDISQLEGLLNLHGLQGLNVTIPYKQEALRFCGQLTPEALAVGAVNCLGRDERGVWWGHNTDVAGFTSALLGTPYYKDIQDSQDLAPVLVCGAGGAALAVRFALGQLGLPEDAIHTVVRRPAGSLPGVGLTYDELTAERLAGYRLMINCTPVGMFPDAEALLPLPLAGLHAGQMVYDLIYNPAETRLLAAARAAGCATLNGMPMLIAQAEAAWAWWRSLAPVPQKGGS